MKRLVLWIMETRPQFLTLSMVLTFLGTAMAWLYGPVNPGYAVLAGIGLMLTHGSANAINDYFDFKSGIDLDVERTPFSGGSGLVPEGKIGVNQALGVGVATTLVALAIGIFFCIQKGWMLMPLLIVAILCLVLYTPVILKTPWPEWSPGLGLGILPLMALHFIQAGHYDWIIVAASVPSGILVHNLLLLNEFPDVAADRKGGRKTTPVLFGMDAAVTLFTRATWAVYGWIIACVVLTLVTGTVIMPVYSLLSFFALPWAIKAIRGSRSYNDRSILVPALGHNVTFILLTQILLGLGYLLEKLVPLTPVTVWP